MENTNGGFEKMMLLIKLIYILIIIWNLYEKEDCKKKKDCMKMKRRKRFGGVRWRKRNGIDEIWVIWEVQDIKVTVNYLFVSCTWLPFCVYLTKSLFLSNFIFLKYSSDFSWDTVDGAVSLDFLWFNKILIFTSQKSLSKRPVFMDSNFSLVWFKRMQHYQLSSETTIWILSHARSDKHLHLQAYSTTIQLSIVWWLLWMGQDGN